LQHFLLFIHALHCAGIKVKEPTADEVKKILLVSR
jgi:hypothetical protein